MRFDQGGLRFRGTRRLQRGILYSDLGGNHTLWSCLSGQVLGPLLQFKCRNLLCQAVISVYEGNHGHDLAPPAERFLLSQQCLLVCNGGKSVQFAAKVPRLVAIVSPVHTLVPFVVYPLSDVVVLIRPETFYKVGCCEDGARLEWIVSVGV